MRYVAAAARRCRRCETGRQTGASRRDRTGLADTAHRAASRRHATLPAVAPPATIPTWWRERRHLPDLRPRSFADGNGDGTGDLAGVRARLPYLRDLGVDAIWFTPVVPLAARRRRLRRRRLPRHRPGVRDARGGRGAHRRGPRRSGSAPSSTSSPTTSRPAPLVPGGARGRPGLAGAGALLVPPRPRRRRRRAADRLALGVQGRRTWTRTTNPDGTPGDWYLHLFTAEQPDLNWDHPDVRAEHEAILRFWFDRGAGRRPDRLRGAARQGPGDAGDPRRPARRASTRSTTATSSTTSTAAGGHRRRVPGHARPRRRGLARGRRAVRALPPPGRAAHGVQLRLHGPAVGRREPARVDRRDARRARAGRRARDLGPVQPRRHPARHPLRPRGLLVRVRPQAVRDADGRRRSAGAGRGPRPAHRRPARLALPLPGRRAGARRGRGPAATRSRTRCTPAPGGIDPGRDGCRVPLPWSGDAAAVRVQPGGRVAPRRGSASRPTGPS